MYMEAPDENAKPLPVSTIMKTTLLVAVAGTIELGVFPSYYETKHEQTSTWLALLAGH